MNAKKALKKLKKKTVRKMASSSHKQLSALKNNALGSPATSKSHTFSSQSELVNELKGVANQAVMSAAYELAAPLNPLLSWFNDAGGVVDFTTAPKNPQYRYQNSQRTIQHLHFQLNQSVICP